MRLLLLFFIIVCVVVSANGQINTTQVVVSGREALENNDYMKAIQYFNLAIQSKPEQAQPYLYRSIVRFVLEDYLGAERDVTRAIELNPFLNEVYEVRGAILQKLGRNEAAISDYEKALEVLPQNKYILNNLAALYHEVGEDSKSNQTFNELFDAYPNFTHGYREYACLLLNSGDSINSIIYLDKAISLNKNNAEDYMMRAYLNFSVMNDIKSAMADMSSAIKLQPTNSFFYTIKGQMRHFIEDYNGAVEDYSMAIAFDSINVNARYNRAICYYKIGEYDKANVDVDVAIKCDSNNALLYFFKSVLCEAKGCGEDANVYYTKAINLSSSMSTIFPKKGVCPTISLLVPQMRVLKQYNCVELNWGRTFEAKPVWLEPVFVVSYYSMKTDSHYSSLFIKEVEEINASKLLRYDLIVTNQEPGVADSINELDHLQAIDYYSYHINAHTPRAIDYFGRAIDYYVLHEYDATIDDLDKAIALSPDFVLGYFVRAISRAKKYNIYDMSVDGNMLLGDIEDADNVELQSELLKILSDWDKVVSLRPRMAIAYYNKASVLIAMGRYSDAIEMYDKAIELEPLMGEAYYNRGYVYFKLGNKEVAEYDVSKAGELGVVAAYNLLKHITR